MVTNVPGFLTGFIPVTSQTKHALCPNTSQKAAEHRGTPQRKRIGVSNDGHVLECGSVLPLLDRRVAPARINPTDPQAKCRFEVEDLAKQKRTASLRFRLPDGTQ